VWCKTLKFSFLDTIIAPSTAKSRKFQSVNFYLCDLVRQFHSCKFQSPADGSVRNDSRDNGQQTADRLQAPGMKSADRRVYGVGGRRPEDRLDARDQQQQLMAEWQSTVSEWVSE